MNYSSLLPKSLARILGMSVRSRLPRDAKLMDTLQRDFSEDTYFLEVQLHISSEQTLPNS